MKQCSERRRAHILKRHRQLIYLRERKSSLTLEFNLLLQYNFKPPSTQTILDIMSDLIRDSPVGCFLRILTRNRWASFPESQPQFKLPGTYSSNLHSTMRDESTLVTWYSMDDPDNPHNWSALKKSWVSFVIMLYTFTVYIGSSLYVSSIEDIVGVFHTTSVIGSLGLSLYVIGYGVAPLLLSPLSEIPSIGRNLPYIITFFMFFICCIPLCLVDNIAGLLILRFLLGCFGSPALATGGASFGDVFSAKLMPYVITLWGGGATMAPVSYVSMYFPLRYGTRELINYNYR